MVRLGTNYTITKTTLQHYLEVTKIVTSESLRVMISLKFTNSLNQIILAHQIPMNTPYSSIHHHLPHHHPPRSHLPRYQLAPAQADVLRERIACDEQDDIDHLPNPSRAPVVRGGASGRGGALDMPSSWRVGSVGAGYHHLEGGELITCFSFSSTLRHGPQQSSCSCCHHR